MSQNPECKTPMIYLHFAIKTELFEFARKNPKPFWSLLSPPILLVDPDFSMIAPPNHRLVGFNHVKSTILLGQIGHFGGLVGGLLGVA